MRGKGDPVIFLHGIGGNKRNWDDNLEYLAHKFRLITWDTRGYGDSEDYFGSFNFEDVVEDLNKVLLGLKIQKINLVGLSMGARIACWFYEKYPNKVKTLVLCDTNFGSRGFSKEEKEEFVSLRSKPFEQGMRIEQFSQAIAKSLIGDSTNKNVLSKLISSLNLLRKDSYIKTVRSFISDDWLNNFSKIRVPCLVMVGELDNLTPPSVAKEIDALIPNSQLKIIEGAGHLINIEKPEIFNELVLKFLCKFN